MRCLRAALPAMVFGWLLLVPPAGKRTSDAYVPDLDAPLRQWDQRSAFDTARECEASKRADRDKYNSVAKPRGVRDAALLWDFARCVPAEALYPTENDSPAKTR